MTEKEVLAILDIEDFRHLTKEKGQEQSGQCVQHPKF